VYDYALSVVGVLPWRCSTCQNRFRARRVPVTLILQAHCPRCGNVHLQRISGDRVDEGPLLPLKRMLNLPAYRCDPCRKKFHSMRPHYRGARPGR